MLPEAFLNIESAFHSMTLPPPPKKKNNNEKQKKKRKTKSVVTNWSIYETVALHITKLSLYIEPVFILWSLNEKLAQYTHIFTFVLNKGSSLHYSKWRV